MKRKRRKRRETKGYKFAKGHIVVWATTRAKAKAKLDRHFKTSRLNP